MKKILITGATGFVGKHLVESILAHSDAQVTGTYRSEPGSMPDNVKLEKVDLHDQEATEALIENYKPDLVYHLAGLPSAAESFKNPAETITNNIVAEISLLEALRKHELIETKVLVVSTAEVYGFISADDLPVDEQTPLRPVNPYAVSKIAQDYLGLQYRLSYRMNIIRVRPFNHIGPGQKENFVLSSFAKQIAEIEKGKKEPIIYVGNLEAKRDFTDVRDMVQAYQLALEKGEKGDVYNLGSGESRKIADMLNMMLSFSTKKVEIKADPERFRPIDVAEIVCDCKKFRDLTGWQPQIPFEQTLQDILDYWRKIV